MITMMLTLWERGWLDNFENMKDRLNSFSRVQNCKNRSEKLKQSVEAIKLLADN